LRRGRLHVPKNLDAANGRRRHEAVLMSWDGKGECGHLAPGSGTCGDCRRERDQARDYEAHRLDINAEVRRIGPSPALSLDAFVAGEKKQSNCACCRLRETQPVLWQEVLNGRARPVPHSYPAIARYLRSLGHAVSHNQLRDHFLANHEENR
jgi:hypothetical protein